MASLLLVAFFLTLRLHQQGGSASWHLLTNLHGNTRTAQSCKRFGTSTS